jgi:hypothetical protein
VHLLVKIKIKIQTDFIQSKINMEMPTTLTLELLLSGVNPSNLRKSSYYFEEIRGQGDWDK